MALRKLNERLDGAGESIAQLERQVRSGQGELADLEARARALHRDLQVGAALMLLLPCRVTYLLSASACVSWWKPRGQGLTTTDTHTVWHQLQTTCRQQLPILGYT